MNLDRMEVGFDVHHDDRELDTALKARLTTAAQGFLSGKDVRCASCRKDSTAFTFLKGGRQNVRVDFYDHDNGWPVVGLPKQWVSVRCRSCGYDTSLSKLKTLEEAREIRRLRGEEVEP